MEYYGVTRKQDPHNQEIMYRWTSQCGGSGEPSTRIPPKRHVECNRSLYFSRIVHVWIDLKNVSQVFWTISKKNVFPEKIFSFDPAMKIWNAILIMIHWYSSLISCSEDAQQWNRRLRLILGAMFNHLFPKITVLRVDISNRWCPTAPMVPPHGFSTGPGGESSTWLPPGRHVAHQIYESILTQ